MSDSKIELLQRMSIFQGVSEGALRCLLTHAPEVRLAAGDHFFRQGDEALYMYVLERGQVRVSKSWEDRDLELGRFGPGDCFGEVALIDMAPRSASVTAETDCTAIEISSVNMHRIFEFDPAQYVIVLTNIARELCRRLRNTDERLMRTVPSTGQGSDDLDWPQLLSF